MDLSRARTSRKVAMHLVHDVSNTVGVTKLTEKQKVIGELQSLCLLTIHPDVCPFTIVIGHCLLRELIGDVTYVSTHLKFNPFKL